MADQNDLNKPDLISNYSTEVLQTIKSHITRLWTGDYTGMGGLVANMRRWVDLGSGDAKLVKRNADGSEATIFDSSLKASKAYVDERDLAETGARNTAISSEATARSNADTALSNAISSEASTRSNADTALSNAISTEVTARSSADTALSNAIALEKSEREIAIGAIPIAKGLGVNGEKWHSVTGSRAFNTQYTNNRTYPIAVSASATCAVTSVIHGYVDGILVSFFQWQFNGCGSFGGAFIIVPPGSTYQLDSGQGVYNWSELYKD